MYKTLLIIFIQIIDKILETRKLFISKGVECSIISEVEALATQKMK